MVKVDALGITTDLSLSFGYLMSPRKKSKPAEGIFVCKTCNKEFGSFQALGGHRTSHNRQKTKAQGSADVKTKPRTHECTICGMEFPMGQALGGHMRRHRPVSDSSSETLQSDHFELLDCGDHRNSSLQLLQLFPE